jgi:hypothetical protein
MPIYFKWFAETKHQFDNNSRDWHWYPGKLDNKDDQIKCRYNYWGKWGDLYNIWIMI